MTFSSLSLFPLDLPKMREYCKTFMAAQAVSLPPYTLESIFSLFRRYVTLSPSLSIFASVISIDVCVDRREISFARAVSIENFPEPESEEEVV